jgi:hypothetical protein
MQYQYIKLNGLVALNIYSVIAITQMTSLYLKINFGNDFQFIE